MRIVIAGLILTLLGFAILISWIVLAVPKEAGFAGIALIILGPLTIVGGLQAHAIRRSTAKELASQHAMDYGRAAPVWNTISLCAPWLGFVCGVVAGVCAPHMQWFEWGCRVWFGFAVFGFLAALCSLARTERWWGVTVSGFLLNLAVLIFTWNLAIHGR